MGIALVTVDLLTRLPLRVEIRCVLVSADVVCVELPLHVEFVEEEAKFSAVGVIQELSVEGQGGYAKRNASCQVVHREHFYSRPFREEIGE